MTKFTPLVWSASSVSQTDERNGVTLKSTPVTNTVRMPVSQLKNRYPIYTCGNFAPQLRKIEERSKRISVFCDKIHTVGVVRYVTQTDERHRTTWSWGLPPCTHQKKKDIEPPGIKNTCEPVYTPPVRMTVPIVKNSCPIYTCGKFHTIFVKRSDLKNVELQPKLTKATLVISNPSD